MQFDILGKANLTFMCYLCYPYHDVPHIDFSACKKAVKDGRNEQHHEPNRRPERPALCIGECLRELGYL